MSIIKNIILNLPVVKKHIEFIENAHHNEINRIQRLSQEELGNMVSVHVTKKSSIESENKKIIQKLSDEDYIINQYKNILNTKMSHEKNRNAEFNLQLVRTNHGDMKIKRGQASRIGSWIKKIRTTSSSPCKILILWTQPQQ